MLFSLSVNLVNYIYSQDLEFLRSDNKTHPVNRKKQINFDEELLIIFYSILNYISERYGFANHINCNFQLITGYRFKTYLDGLGKTRLLQIKYKYFSDKALHLWQLCYDFFDNAKRMNIQQERKEYLLVKHTHTP